MPKNSKAYWKNGWYKKYQWTEKAKKERAARNKARRAAIKAGKVKKWDWKDVHHKDRNPLNNKSSNIAVVSKKYNRKDWAKKANSNPNRKKKYAKRITTKKQTKNNIKTKKAKR